MKTYAEYQAALIEAQQMYLRAAELRQAAAAIEDQARQAWLMHEASQTNVVSGVFEEVDDD